ncbi:MAG: carbohydrate kinase family protein [Tepidiformaceae bacterium]
MAHALGARVTLLTTLTATFDAASLEGLAVPRFPVNSLPRYANAYDGAGNRAQLLLSPGEALELTDIHFEIMPDLLIIAPAYHELTVPPAIPARFTAMDLQGPLRTVEGETVRSHPQPRTVVDQFVREGDYVFFSEEDAPDAEGLARYAANRGATVLLTRGYRGATVISEGHERHLEALLADSVDPTGAGDYFATAVMVRLAETNDLAQACAFALAAGALSVAAVGLAGVPTREQLEHRLAREAA